MHCARKSKHQLRQWVGFFLVFSISANSLCAVGSSAKGSSVNGSFTKARIPDHAGSPNSAKTNNIPATKTNDISVTDRKRVVETVGNLPLSFEANLGQAQGPVKFSARVPGYRLLLTPQEAVMVLANPPEKTARPTRQKKSLHHADIAASVLKMKLVGANKEPLITGENEQLSKSNYFIGDDPEKWRTDVPNYSRVKYEAVYPGVDLIYYGSQRQLEYDFVVSPGADPEKIRLQFEGARKLFLDRKGDLVLVMKGGVIRQHRPVVYQEVNGVRQGVKSKYYLIGKGQVGIELGTYDRSRTLFIDPILSYSTYFGGSGGDIGMSIAVDAEHNIYVAGNTTSTDLIMVNAFQSTNMGGDNIGGWWEVFVTKFNPTGTEVVFSTFLGGTKTDVPYGVAVDPAGNVYVAGQTWSNNFPRANAYDQTFGGSGTGFTDAFITKLSPSGNSLIYSTYLGGNCGNNQEGAKAIAVDEAGNAYVAGQTLCSDFPVMNAYQSARAGDTDGFVSKFDATGLLTYSTFLGGSSSDIANSIALDSTSNIYVAGWTSSTNFPIVSAFQTSRLGSSDGFVSKLNPTGSTLIYSSYFGGGSSDSAEAIAVDDSGHAYLTGYTTSGTTFPLVNAYQTTFGGGPFPQGYDSFVAKVHPSGASLVYSTYLGGNHYDEGNSIAVDSSGNAYVAGETLSTNFPVSNAVQPNKTGVREGFISKLGPTGATLPFSSYLGGSSYDIMVDVALDSNGDLYLTGETDSTNFPTASPFQGSVNGGADAFIVKITGLTGYSITGTVTDAAGAGMSGVTLTLTGSQSGTKVTGSNGTFIFDVPSGGNYTVTPSKSPFVFTPTNRTFNNLSGNQTANFTTVVYAISGRVANSQGIGLSDATLTLSGTQTGTTQTDGDGNYSFPTCAAGGNYTITPSKISFNFTYAFNPGNRSFTNLSGNQTAADFTYTTSTQMTFNLVADAYVQDGTAASTNFGSVTPMLLKTTNQADQRRDVYLKFDLSILGRTIVNAKLRIYASLSAAGSVTTTAYKVADTGWSESGITWANKPERGTTLSTVAVTTTTYAAYELDVTSYVLEEKAAGRNVISLALHNPSNSTPHILVHAREAATNKPQLVLTTSDTSNAAPAVSLTAPNGGASLTAPANITVSANASDTDGTISKVDFYAGNSQIGSDTTAPYSIQWNGVTAGAYSLTALATDNYGSSTTSSAVGISVVPGNNGPAVTLTAPLGGLMFAAGSNIGLEATASDSDGTVSKVDFYAGAQLVGTDTTAPYSVVWSNAAAGAHNLTAIATDNNNNTSTSNAVSVSVVWQTGLSPTMDAYVRDGSSATTNFGTALELQTQMSTTGNNRETYVKFDITALSGIVSAKLRLNGRLLDSSGSNVPAAVYPCVNCAWTESGSGSLTWNNKPVVTGAALSSVTITDQNARWYEWDVTTYIQEEKTAGRNTVTLVLKNTATSSPYATFNSREASSLQPQLAMLSTAVRNILLVTGSSTLNTSETALKTRMENLGFTVTVKAAGSNQNSAVKTTDADGKAAVVISSTVTPANVLAKFRHVPLPVLLWEFDLLDDQGMTEASAGFFGTQTSQSALALLNTTHPMAAGLTSPVSVVSPASTFTWGTPNTNAVQIAALTGDATRIAIFGYETEAAMPGLPPPAGLPAPARRVAFFLTDTNGITLTAGGQALFDAAIKWLTAMTVTPTITSVDPILGTIGTAVTVSGYNFGDSQGSSSLKFNGTNATASNWTTTTISALVPSGASTGAVTVVVNGKTSNGITFTVNVPPLDVDGDGLADAWELQYFGNLNQGANDDPDGDTVSNLQEYLQGRNPTVSSVSDLGGAINLRLYTPLLPLGP